MSRERKRHSANPLEHVDARVLALRLAFRTMGPLAPARAARLAEKIFTRPPVHALREGELEFLATGESFRVQHGSQSLAAWQWGSGPVILLMHGWGSRASRFRYFVPPLVAAGFRAVALDGPGHGQTGGTRASLPEFAAALTAVGKEVGPVRGYVGHSLGAAATLFGMRKEATPGPAVLLAPPADPALFWQRFVQHLQIPESVRARTQANRERRVNLSWDELDARTTAGILQQPLLVIHDEQDEDVPAADGAAIARAASNATLVLTQGLGHRGVMRDPGIVARAVAFLEANVAR